MKIFIAGARSITSLDDNVKARLMSITMLLYLQVTAKPEIILGTGMSKIFMLTAR